jgi:hypothetical protein
MPAARTAATLFRRRHRLLRANTICGGASILQSRHRGWRQLTSKTYDASTRLPRPPLENDEQEWLLRVPRIDNNSETN